MRLPTLLAGILIGAGAMAALTGTSLRSSLLSPSPTLPRSAAEVDASAWKYFHSTVKGFALRYPESYELAETDTTVTLTATTPVADGIGTVIHLEKLRTPLSRLLLPEMRLGSWKVADRRTYVLTTSYLTGDDRRTLSEIYLFARDLPYETQQPKTDVVVRATVVLSRNEPSFLLAKRTSGLDVESVLTEPEQILSTFRFLQFNELPERN